MDPRTERSKGQLCIMGAVQDCFEDRTIYQHEPNVVRIILVAIGTKSVIVGESQSGFEVGDSTTGNTWDQLSREQRSRANAPNQ